MANKLESTGSTVQDVAAAAISAGTFAFESTVPVFYSKDADAGDTVAGYVGGVTIKVLKDSSADVYALGADVFGDQTAQTALTVGGDGQLGVAAADSAASETHVLVRMTN